MAMRDPDHDARTRAAWDAFVREDRATGVPPGLDARVRAAVAARRTGASTSRRRISVLAWSLGIGVAAAVIAAVGVLARPDVLDRWEAVPASSAATSTSPSATGGASPAPAEPSGLVGPVEQRRGARGERGMRTASAVTGASQAVRRRPARAVEGDRARPVGAVARAATRAAVAIDDLVPADGEALQIVRVRMPSSSLPALGVRVSAPSLDGPVLVDVDLVVGVDGWPREVRDIRQVRAADVQP